MGEKITTIKNFCWHLIDWQQTKHPRFTKRMINRKEVLETVHFLLGSTSGNITRSIGNSAKWTTLKILLNIQKTYGAFRILHI